MATAADSVKTMARGAFPSLGDKIGIIENTINLATIAAELVAQGDGTLAATDVIQALSLPAGTYVMAAGIEVTTAVAGATELVLDLGYNGNNLFVDGSDTGSPFDIGSSGNEAAVGTYSQQADPITTTEAGKRGWVVSSADTLDVTVTAMTGTLTAGGIRVWAIVADIDGLDG